MWYINPARRSWDINAADVSGIRVQFGRLGSGNIVEPRLLESTLELSEKLGELKEMATQAGRPFESIDITTNWRIVKKPDALPELEDLGVSRVVVLLGATGESDSKKAIDLIASRAGL